MRELKLLLKKFNIRPQKAYKSYIEKFPLENNKFNDAFLTKEYNKHNLAMTTHPIVAFMEIQNNQFVYIKFSNLTHTHCSDKKLMQAQSVPNKNEFIIGLGFDKLYDLNDAKKKAECLNFVNYFGKNIVSSSPNYDLNYFHINYHNINKIEKHSDHFINIVIKKMNVSNLPTDIITTNQIYAGHAAPLNKNIKENISENQYALTKIQHKNLSQDTTLTKIQRNEHIDIIDSMTVYQKMLKFFSSGNSP